MDMRERALLVDQCRELASQKRWEHVDAVCRQVLARRDLSEAQRADWMCMWASWMYNEGLSGGRSRYGRVRTLLSEALPLAKSDPRVTAHVCVGQTAIGDDVDAAVRRFRRLLAQHPELSEYAGRIYFNLGYDYQHVPRFTARAAQAYRRAMRYLQGQELGRAWHNYAVCCIELGWFRKARQAIAMREELVSDPPMALSLKALLAVAEGDPEAALALVQDGLAHPECSTLAKAYLYHAATTAYHKLERPEEFELNMRLAWQHAAEVGNMWTLMRLGLLLRQNPRGAASASEGGVDQ